MLINSCDVWSLRYLGAESSWLWLSCISKELLHFLSIYWCVRQLVHIWFVGKLIKFRHKRWMSKALWYYRYIGLTMCVSLNTDLFVLHYCQCHTYIRSSYLMYQFYQDKRRGTRIKKVYCNTKRQILLHSKITLRVFIRVVIKVGFKYRHLSLEAGQYNYSCIYIICNSIYLLFGQWQQNKGALLAKEYQ